MVIGQVDRTWYRSPERYNFFYSDTPYVPMNWSDLLKPIYIKG
jgi:hypothetical protein